MSTEHCVVWQMGTLKMEAVWSSEMFIPNFLFVDYCKALLTLDYIAWNGWMTNYKSERTWKEMVVA
jgi:hypothetical protein